MDGASSSLPHLASLITKLLCQPVMTLEGSSLKGPPVLNLPKGMVVPGWGRDSTRRGRAVRRQSARCACELVTCTPDLQVSPGASLHWCRSVLLAPRWAAGVHSELAKPGAGGESQPGSD